MNVEPAIAILGALIGVPARANILSALMNGRAQTATQLAYYAGVSPQTTSSHLAKLTDAKLLVAERHGRHRYYRLADPAIVDAIEPLTQLIAKRPVPARRRSKALEDLRAARMCYDHLAGGLGVALTDGLLAQGHLVPVGRDFRATAEGERFLAQFGLDLTAIRAQRRLFARQCLDWSERRPHLGGALGASLAARCLARKWIHRAPEGRKVVLTASGRRALGALLPGFAG
jgi:DNA-binding transcriptional ArsR family regulator